MNPKLRRMLGSELFEQLSRVKILAYTDRGEYEVTSGEPRLFKANWKKAILGFADEPWDVFGDVRTNALIDVERLGGRIQSGTETVTLPNWWFVSIGLEGWYRQDAYIDDKLVLSKPQTDPWNNVSVPQASFIWWKLGEHDGPTWDSHQTIWAWKKKLRLHR